MAAKRRRSARVPKAERLLLNITSPVAVQEIALTVEVSEHGAKVLSRRRLLPESRGSALLISAGRQAPCRIAWQKAPGPDGRMETGVEIYSNTNFWGLGIGPGETAPAPQEPPEPPAPEPAAAAPPSARELLEQLQAQAVSDSFPLQLWGELVDALEAKGVFTRDELIGMLRKLSRD